MTVEPSELMLNIDESHDIYQASKKRLENEIDEILKKGFIPGEVITVYGSPKWTTRTAAALEIIGITPWTTIRDVAQMYKNVGWSVRMRRSGRDVIVDFSEKPFKQSSWRTMLYQELVL